MDHKPIPFLAAFGTDTAPAYARQQRLQHWEVLNYVKPQERTVSVLGLGALGKVAVTRLLQANFKVCAWSRSPKPLIGGRRDFLWRGRGARHVRSD